MKKSKVISLSLVVMALWGSLFPLVKTGYAAFGIDSKSVADILMFAAMRFSVCGGAVSLFCLARRKSAPAPDLKSVLGILWVGVFAIILHYACTYIGLATTASSKTALLKQSGALIYVCFSFLFFKDEKFSIYKIIGAIIGFCGIIAINTSGGGLSFSFGDLLILSASLCTVAANVISRKTTQTCSPLWTMGISQFFGGIVLLLAAFSLGGSLPVFSIRAGLVFACICTFSIISYALWYYILKTTELSSLFIIKFAEPIFACIFGAILLGENILSLQYLAAFVLVSLGIIIGHHTPKKGQSHD